MGRGFFKVLWCFEPFSKSSEDRLYNDLPDDILDKIMNELELLSDFIRFGGVCTSWYRVFSQRKRHRIEWYNNEAPLLFIPPAYADRHILPKHLSPSHNDIVALPNQLFHVLENKWYDSKSPIDIPLLETPSSFKVLSASYGWLATIMRNNVQTIISLKNPITGKTISLPTIPVGEDWNITIPVGEDWNITSVALSCDPAIYPDKCVVAYRSCTGVAFIRVCGKTWNIFSPLTERMITSILFHRGKWYVLTPNLELIVIDCFWERNDPDKCVFKSCNICKEMSNFEGETSAFGTCGQSLHLVENESGELLGIGCKRSYGVTDIVMWKLVITEDKGINNMKGHWVRIYRLGNGVLFLDDCGNNAMCSKSMNLHRGSVYVLNAYGAGSFNNGYDDVRRIVRMNKRMQEVAYIQLCGVWENYFRVTQPLWIKQVLQQQGE